LRPGARTKNDLEIKKNPPNHGSGYHFVTCFSTLTSIFFLCQSNKSVVRSLILRLSEVFLHACLHPQMQLLNPGLCSLRRLRC
jgi:hypothetical protein